MVFHNSDGSFSFVHRARVLVDIVDDEWAADTLAVDDIEVPPQHDVPAEAEDEAHREEAETNENKWTEMGLAEFSQ